MNNHQWFRLKGNLQRIACEWYIQYWIPYLEETRSTLALLKAKTPIIENYYYKKLATGESLIIGVSVLPGVAKDDLNGWKKSLELFSCFSPDLRTIKGREANLLISEIERSPILFEPIRKELELPLFWSKPNSDRVVFPSFICLDDQRIFLAIDVNHALEYAGKYPDLEMISGMQLKQLKSESNELEAFET